MLGIKCPYVGSKDRGSTGIVYPTFYLLNTFSVTRLPANLHYVPCIFYQILLCHVCTSCACHVELGNSGRPDHYGQLVATPLQQCCTSVRDVMFSVSHQRLAVS